MGLPFTDLVLLILAIVIVVVDIILALCLGTVLPYHVKSNGWYPADGSRRSFEEAAAICPCLIKVFPGGTKREIQFDQFSSNKLRQKRAVPENPRQIEKYPYLVSLSIPAFSDYTEEKLFACNGLIENADWLLTTKNCVRDESEWYNLTVRSGSSYWSKEGVLHSVTAIRKDVDTGLISLKITPPFSEKFIPSAEIKLSFSGNWTYAFSLGWDDQMYEKSPKLRYKYKTFDVEEWTSRSCASDIRNVCNTSEAITSIPLLTSCHQLLGMKSGKNKGFSAIAPLNFENKCYSIFKDTCGFKDVEVCTS